MTSLLTESTCVWWLGTDLNFRKCMLATTTSPCSWEDNPKCRPSAEQILKTVCLSPMHSVMCVFPVCSQLSLRHAIALTTAANLFEVGTFNKFQNELWVWCDGAELSIYNSHTMKKTHENFIKDNQVQCVVLCNGHYGWGLA